MTIDIGIDRKGHSLRTLVYQALEKYSTSSLLPLLRDRNAIVRTAAARQLQMRPDHKIFYHGVELASSKKRSDREVAAFLLGQLGTPHQPFRAESIPVLEKLCSDHAYEVRLAAVAALGHLKAVEAASTLKRAKRDSHQQVREMALYVQEQLA